MRSLVKLPNLEYFDINVLPEVNDDELVVYVNPVCPFAMRALLTVGEKLGTEGYRVLNISLT